jgi:hypothetical protein
MHYNTNYRGNKLLRHLSSGVGEQVMTVNQCDTNQALKQFWLEAGLG